MSNNIYSLDLPREEEHYKYQQARARLELPLEFDPGHNETWPL